MFSTPRILGLLAAIATTEAVGCFALGYACCHHMTVKKAGVFPVYRKEGSNDLFAHLGTNGDRKWDEPKKAYFCPVVKGELWKFHTREVYVNEKGEYRDGKDIKYEQEM
jgi:hypothetical protein